MPRSWSHLVNLALVAWIVVNGVLNSQWTFALGGVATAALLYATIWLIGQYPEHANAPHQEKYDALPRTDKQRVMGVMQRWVCWETAGILAVIAGVQMLSSASALSSTQETLILVGVLGFTVLSTGAVPFLIWRVQATVDALHDRMQRSDS